MTPYYTDGWVTIYHGETLNVLDGLDDCAFAAVVADPPRSNVEPVPFLREYSET